MHQALYRKWRPLTFDDVCGQDHITEILKYETSRGKTSHAYLFCGSRGTGKTTCAKILSRAVNCEHPVNGNPCGECYACKSILDGSTTDVLEMDAASNNKVDDIRTILDEVIYTPSVLKYRVYIIDEVHMLTTSAFNALLKTLEEPPEHVIFILATTEMQKLPATIISRCQRFDFRRIPADILTDRLNYIAKAENIPLDPDAALIIARLAQGGMRDAISLFELCSAGGNAVTPQSVSDTVGFRGRGPMSECVRAIASKDYGRLFSVIAEIDGGASDISVFWQELIGYYRDMLVIKTAGAQAGSKYLDLTDSETDMITKDAAMFSKEVLSFHSGLLDDAYASMGRPGMPSRTVAELTFIKMCDEKLMTDSRALLARIAALEAKIASGYATAAAAVPEEKPAPPERHAEPVSDSEAPAKAIAPKTASSPVKEASKRVLRPIRAWSEIAEEFSRAQPAAGAMLATEKVYTDSDGKIVVCYSKEITKTLINRPAVLSSLSGIISLSLGRSVGTGDISFEKIEAGRTCPTDSEILAEELGAMADGQQK